MSFIQQTRPDVENEQVEVNGFLREGSMKMISKFKQLGVTSRSVFDIESICVGIWNYFNFLR